MFEKRADYKFIDPVLLNVPDIREEAIKKQTQKIYDEIVFKVDEKIIIDTIAKIAATKEDPVFDLEKEIKDHADSLFIKCFAIKADETNDNGDYFSQKELMKATPTFIGVPLFTNHSNSDINEARGKVVHSWWDDEKNGIMIIGRVDAAAYPQLARGIKEQYVIGTSMGCQVQHSICSICHNLAESPEQYCSCIRERKTRQVVARKQQCRYHDHGLDTECPVCECKKGEKKAYAVNDKAFEYNFGIKFIENSFVVNPACHNCGVTEIIDPQKFLAKVAEIQAILPNLLKIAGEHPLTCTDRQCIKIAGQEELDNLNQAVDMISSVSKAMLDQKEQIDLEFLSDLVKVLADLQGVTDELTEQGYGRLQSPGQAPTSEPSPEGINSPDGEVTRSVQPMNPTPGGGSKVHSGPAGQVGNVTGPLAKRKELTLQKLSLGVPVEHVKNKISLVLPKFELETKETDEKLDVSKKLDLKFRFQRETV